MKNSNTIFVILIFTLLLSLSNSSFGQNTSIALRVGSLGVGVEATRSFTSTINGRFGLNYFTYNYNGQNSAGDVLYDLDLNLFSFSLLADWYPFKADFHISGGLLYNSNKIEGVGTPARSFIVGGTIYTPEKLGTLDAKVEPNLKLSPYLGLGWGNAVNADKKLGFVVDIGMIYQGSPDVTLTANGLMEPTSEQEPNVEDDIKNLRFYPVISLGLTYQF